MGWYDDSVPQESEPEPRPVDEFFGKLDYEGGYSAACGYGLRTEDYRGLPKEMVDEWNEIRAAYDEFDDLTRQFSLKWEPSV